MASCHQLKDGKEREASTKHIATDTRVVEAFKVRFEMDKKGLTRVSTTAVDNPPREKR